MHLQCGSTLPCYCDIVQIIIVLSLVFLHNWKGQESIGWEFCQYVSPLMELPHDKCAEINVLTPPSSFVSASIPMQAHFFNKGLYLFSCFNNTYTVCLLSSCWANVHEQTVKAFCQTDRQIKAFNTELTSLPCSGMSFLILIGFFLK